MKIVHICMGFPVEFHGGITNYVRSLASEQSSSDCNVVVYCNGEEGVSTEKYDIKRYNSKIRNFSLNHFAKDDTYQDFLYQLQVEKADIYHFHSLLGIDNRFTGKFVELGLKYIISLHDYNFICPRVFMVHKTGDVCRDINLTKCSKCVGQLEQVDIFERISKKYGLILPSVKSNSIFERFDTFKNFIENATLVLPVSQRVNEIFSKVFNFKSKVLHIGNETANFDVELKNIDSEKLNVAFMGTFTKIKGAELFIELCKKNTNKNLNFILYGRGDEVLIKKLVDLGGLYMGPYTQNSLPDILKEVHIGAVLSIWEDNGPQVVMELINQRTPVLGTNRGGIPDFIDDSNGFVFEPDDGISSALSWLNEIEKNKNTYFKNDIKKLKTPKQHAQELKILYQDIFSKY